MNKSLRWIVFSDVHLGHRKTPTEHILESLYGFLRDQPEIKDIDIIAIPGDLFDRYLGLPADEVYEIHRFIAYLLRLCKKHDILLRILEGTPSHDWKQSRLIESINRNAGIDADAHYADVLSIEYIERFNINILYVPDEWSNDNDDTWKQVQRLLVEKQLDKVDYVMMHGMFPHQLPPNVNLHTHVPERYIGICKYFIFCGHVHKPSQFDKILVPGSTDRLTHNEEEPKGYLDLTVHPSGESDIRFMENKNAMTYKTIDCTGMSEGELYSYVEKAIEGLRVGSHLRLKGTSADPIAACLDVLKRKYYEFQWSPPKIENVGKSMKDSINDLRATYQHTAITPKTIRKLVEDELILLGVDADQLKACNRALTEVLT